MLIKADYLTLGIESSCDETAVAIFSEREGLIAHQLHSQIKTHFDYGGVVPELASRDHIKYGLPLLKRSLDEANLVVSDIDGIAYTKGPGLAGALLSGSALAKSLAFGLGIPSLGVHHLEGHLLSPFLEYQKPSFPFLSLLVSGGHTILLVANGLGDYQLLGQSLDDAVGEAFDKVAKLIGLGYPGGAELAKLALDGRAGLFNFPRPMLNKDNLDFSFSGLKTFVRNVFLDLKNPNRQDLADIAYEFEQAVGDVLTSKTEKALVQNNLQQLVVSGGVSANKTLRAKIDKMGAQLGVQTFYPRFEFCTDNAAMIALVGHLYLQQGKKDASDDIIVNPSWEL